MLQRFITTHFLFLTVLETTLAAGYSLLDLLMKKLQLIWPKLALPLAERPVNGQLEGLQH